MSYPVRLEAATELLANGIARVEGSTVDSVVREALRQYCSTPDYVKKHFPDLAGLLGKAGE